MSRPWMVGVGSGIVGWLLVTFWVLGVCTPRVNGQCWNYMTWAQQGLAPFSGVYIWMANHWGAPAYLLFLLMITVPPALVAMYLGLRLTAGIETAGWWSRRG